MYCRYLYTGKESCVERSGRLSYHENQWSARTFCVVLAKGLFISPDIVAVDTAAAKFFNQVREMPLDTVGHLAKGEALKIGTMNIDKLNVKRIKM